MNFCILFQNYLCTEFVNLKTSSSSPDIQFGKIGLFESNSCGSEKEFNFNTYYDPVTFLNCFFHQLTMW